MTLPLEDLAWTEHKARPPRRRRRFLLAGLGLFALFAVAIGGGALWAKDEAETAMQTIGDPFEELPVRPANPAPLEKHLPTNILLLGSDSRISAGDPSKWAYGAQRTDAIMLVHIPSERKSAITISIPRDTWVPIPGYGEDKINAAFSYGGPTLLIQTIEAWTGIKIDHFMVSDFESFARITDQLGGVMIDGELLSGDEALAYTRERSSLPRGDLDRVKRQQNWLLNMVNGVALTSVWTDPAQVKALADLAVQSFTVDANFDAEDMVDLAMDLRAGGPGLYSFTIPVAGTGTSPDGTQSIIRLNPALSQEVFTAIVNDDLEEFVLARSGELDMLGSYVP